MENLLGEIDIIMVLGRGTVATAHDESEELSAFAGYQLKA